MKLKLDENFGARTQRLFREAGFPPQRAGGIVVIRAPHNPSLALLENLAQQFLMAAESHSPSGRLWIVEVGRVRIHQPDSDKP